MVIGRLRVLAAVAPCLQVSATVDKAVHMWLCTMAAHAGFERLTLAPL